MSRSCVRRQKDVTLFAESNYLGHHKSQSHEVTHEKALHSEWEIGEVGNPLLIVRDAVLATKGSKRMGTRRLSGKNLTSVVTKFYEDLPDEINKELATQLHPTSMYRKLYFNGASRVGPDRHVVE